MCRVLLSEAALLRLLSRASSDEADESLGSDGARFVICYLAAAESLWAGLNHYQRAERLCALRFAGNTLDVRGERGRSQSQQGGTVKREPIRVDRSLP